jgi:hypothetical protein
MALASMDHTEFLQIWVKYFNKIMAASGFVGHPGR